MISLYTLDKELSKGTVGKQIERSDFELGLETLLMKWCIRQNQFARYVAQ